MLQFESIFFEILWRREMTSRSEPCVERTTRRRRRACPSSIVERTTARQAGFSFGVERTRRRAAPSSVVKKTCSPSSSLYGRLIARGTMTTLDYLHYLALHVLYIFVFNPKLFTMQKYLFDFIIDF